MPSFWVFVFVGIVLLAAVAIGLAGNQLSKSTRRVARSYAPIEVKIKAFGIEVSALKRSRLDRQRRLETDGSSEIDTEELGNS
jgi:hypothetical protein